MMTSKKETYIILKKGSYGDDVKELIDELNRILQKIAKRLSEIEDNIGGE